MLCWADYILCKRMPVQTLGWAGCILMRGRQNISVTMCVYSAHKGPLGLEILFLKNFRSFMKPYYKRIPVQMLSWAGRILIQERPNLSVFSLTSLYWFCGPIALLIKILIQGRQNIAGFSLTAWYCFCGPIALLIKILIQGRQNISVFSLTASYWFCGPMPLLITSHVRRQGDI